MLSPCYLAGARAIIKVLGHQRWWLAGGYDLETGHIQKWLAWWLSGGSIVAFLRCDTYLYVLLLYSLNKNWNLFCNALSEMNTTVQKSQ